MTKQITGYVFRITVAGIVSLLVSVLSSAQTDDSRIWNKLSVEKKLKRHYSLEVAAGIRIGQNYSRLETYYLDAGINYQLNKHWSCELHYRYSERRLKTDLFDTRNRGYFGVEYKTKWWDVVVAKFYVRYQRQYTNMFTSEEGFNASDYIRSRYTLKFDLNKKYTPYVSGELFYQMKYYKSEFNRVRYEAGISYKINKHHSFDAFYMIQREFNEPNPAHSYIVGLYYKINI